MRVDGRQPDQLRAISITPHFNIYAEGSALIDWGKTRVLCNVTLENTVPAHQRGTGKGWLTAEYSMIPRASQQRKLRELYRGYPLGRTQEIQRMIGRSLRAVVDLGRLGERTLILDCEVLQADGGTRTAAISGAFVALGLAFEKLRERNQLSRIPISDYLAAVSVGIVEGRAVLDLNYLEDAGAEVDMNVVMTGGGRFVEVQGTAEGTPFDAEQMQALLELAQQGIHHIVELQKEFIRLSG